MSTKRVTSQDGQPTERKRLRLVKVLVQPVVVWDDGESLTEQSFEPVACPAEEWPDFPARLAEELKGLEEKANE